MTALPPVRPPVKGRKGKYAQRTLLDATDIPAPGFVQAFCASQQLSQQLAQERHFNANGQAAYLKKKQQQLAYVEEAHRREQPPLETVAAPEIMRGELRRDAVFHHGAAGVPAPLTGPAALDLTDLRGGGVPIVKVGNEALACREKRLERQKDFLASRKVRHDQALEEFQRALDVLSEECQQEVFAATERVKKDLEEKIAESNAILKPLEPPPLPERPEGEEPLVLDETTLLDELHDLPLDGTIDPAKAKAVAAENAALKALRSLGERTEGEVRGILAAELLKTLVEALTAAAHVVHGEAERIVEGHALSFDEVLLDNRKAMNQLEAKLTVQALEDNKDYKVRWHKGLLLWKQQRHRHSMAVVMRRIRSNEFRQPDSLVEAVAKVREHQAFVFLQRRDLMEETGNRLTVAAVRQLEEQNTQLNDRAQETFDTLLVELRELREALNVSAEQMLGELGLELEEWKGHDSVANLIDAEVRPPLRECLDPVAEMLQLLSNKLTHQEEALHLAVTGVITFFSNLAKRQELLKKRVEEFEVNYNGEVEDCEKDFEDTCERNENKMKELHTAIDDAAHHETLEELKQETFDHLDQMAETVALKAERAAHAAQLEADAIAAAEAAHAAPDGEDEAAKEARLQALAAAIETAKTQLRQDAEAREAEAVEAEAAAFEGLEEKSLWVSAEDVPLGRGLEWGKRGEQVDWSEGTGCKVLEKKSLPELRGTVLQEHPIDGPSDADGAPDGTAAAADGADDGATDGSDAEPVFADGTRALETLSFDHSWFEENLYGLREAIFQNLQTQKRYLDRVDIPAACEEVRRDLDQRLRRHTNRKGEVQVEWYVPRYGTVSKHKDRFERHLISVAHKCQDQDDAVEKALEEVEKAEEEFKQRLVREEQYSEPEIVYYGGEIQELNSTLDERMQERAQKAHDLEAAVDEKCKAPMHTFSEAYAAAVESLCASKGYGRKYGEPRRKAQERVRTLIARAKTVGSNVELLLDYVKKLLALPLEDGLEMSAMPPPPRIMSIRHFFERGGETWSFPSEALGVLYVAVCTMAELGTHLGAFKEAYVSKYELAAVPWLRILREDACLMPPAEQQQEEWNAHRKAEAAKKALSFRPVWLTLEFSRLPSMASAFHGGESCHARSENSAENEAEAESAIQLSRSLEASSALRDDSLLRVLGPLMKSEKFNDEIQLVIKASHEAYAGQASFVATGLSRVCAGFLFVGSNSSARNDRSPCRTHLCSGRDVVAVFVAMGRRPGRSWEPKSILVLLLASLACHLSFVSFIGRGRTSSVLLRATAEGGSSKTGAVVDDSDLDGEGTDAPDKKKAKFDDILTEADNFATSIERKSRRSTAVARVSLEDELRGLSLEDDTDLDMMMMSRARGGRAKETSLSYRINKWFEETKEMIVNPTRIQVTYGMIFFATFLKFLSDMQVSCEHARQEDCRALRDWGDQLREETLMQLGEQLFSELTARALVALAKSAQEAQQQTVQLWIESDKKRALHEQRLSPRLADANKSAELEALVQAEEQRHQEATQTCQQDPRRMALVLRRSCESFVCRLTTVAEVSIRLLDLLPLHSHFGSLPGDEKVEPPRMSIKRRMRRLNREDEAPEPVPKAAAKGKAAAKPPPEEPKEKDAGLPERQWTGVPKYELRAMLVGSKWPEDEMLPEEEFDQKKLELTETLKSFRSPVHRKIIEGPGGCYERYKQSFIAEVQRRSTEMSLREAKEEAGERKWQSMIRQLRVKVQVYDTDPGSILIVNQNPMNNLKIKEFVMAQPHVDYYELNQRRSYPDGRTAPIVPDAERKERIAQIPGRLGDRRPEPVRKPAPTAKTGKGAKAE
eukprot:g12184.t1